MKEERRINNTSGSCATFGAAVEQHRDGGAAWRCRLCRLCVWYSHERMTALVELGGGLSPQRAASEVEMSGGGSGGHVRRTRARSLSL